MNKKNMVNTTALFTILAGGFFKSNNFAGADFLLLTGTFFLVISLLYMSREMYQEATPLHFNYAASMALILHGIGATFTLLKWAGGNSCISLGLIMSVLAVIFYLLNKGNFKIPKQFAVCAFLYLLLVLNLFGIWNLNI